MSTAVIADKKPAVLTLQPGTYYWRACGRSKQQPYCDGSHAGTEFTPMAFAVTEATKVALCSCKQTENKPFCDGAHANRDVWGYFPNNNH